MKTWNNRFHRTANPRHGSRMPTCRATGSRTSGVWQAAIMKKGNYYPFDIKSCYGIIGDMDGSMYEKRKLLSIE